MYEDPRYDGWFRENLTRLVRFRQKMEGTIDVACAAVGINQEELTWFRTSIPKLCEIAFNESVRTYTEDPAIPNVMRRILNKTSPMLAGGCMRWLGTIQGEHKRPDGRRTGTPVIGFKGRTVPARRLLWQLKHAGSDQILGDDERLHGVRCLEGSMCMNLTHWYRKAPSATREDLGAVRALLGEAELMDDRGEEQAEHEARWCRSGEHFLPAGCHGCPECAAQEKNHHTRDQRLAYAVGRALRGQLAPMSPQ